ncbi:DUF3300 domain-containing protein [Rheinheimera sp. MM224]|uniref:DUF3300 domain-containing protein n=1 Tax=Rheinheimera sp. MM224 TaxID=3019969 RepID=UPI0021F829BB|nr:DUF3300 domain-containing protein [Rheinheimera sp. MM224]CAI3799678.1 hypothetical protein JAMGFMIE_02390 [Rheinheimera sp. MM224]
MRALMKCLPLLSVALFPALLVAPVAAQQTASAGSTVQSFSQAELDAMLAPIALYPDTVLSHVLIASTYPLEIIKANRWVEEHPRYSAEEALEQVEDEDWDPSVKALVPFPQLLERMSDDIDWTQRLGDAFLGQEAQVMTSIQTLRNKAYASGNLDKQEHIKVVRQEKTIIIEPASPQVVYIPYYDPQVVYGPWWWHSYPPVYWHVPVGYAVHRGFSWGVGIQIAPGFYFSSFHWPRRQIVVIDHHHHWRDPYYYRSHQIVHHKNSHHWRHNPHHRRGVSYQAGYQPTREFSGNRSYQNRDQQREWAAQTRENKGYAPDRKFNSEKAQRFDEKERQFDRNKKGDDLIRRAKEEGPRAQVEPTNSRDFKDRQQVLRQELKNNNRQDPGVDRAVKQPRPDVVRPERSYQTQRTEQTKFERPVQQPRVEAVRPERNYQTPRVEQPRPERSYQQPRVEQPRVERSYQQPRVEQPRVERSYQQPRVQQPRMEQPRAQSREMRSSEGRRQIE